MVQATAPRIDRPRVVAWAAWDWGSAAFNVVITTFVFSVYLTGDDFVARGLASGTPAFDLAKAGLSSGLGWGIALAGVVVALLAPVAGRRADLTGRRRRGVATGTGVVVLAMLLMVLIAPDPALFWPGVALFGVGTIAYELAAVDYNAMLLSVSGPRTIGRISAFGWASGYVGGIVLLLVLLFTLIPNGLQLVHLPALDDGRLGIRLCALASAVWFAVFAVPVLVAVPDEPRTTAPARVGVLATYRRLGLDVAALWRADRNAVSFLIASAVFRDGLTGVFTFGAVIAATVFGFSFGEVVIFAIAANLVAGASTVLSGRFDDRYGPKPVILTSLIGLVITGAAVFLARDAGQIAFWIGGLLLCLFVGPAQTSSRSFLGRIAPEGRVGELFGLYATTGRAASFIAPAAFAAFTAVARDQAFGILGIVLVIAVGLVLMLRVRDAPSPAEGAGGALEGTRHA